jgi:hypothetical protein
VSSTIAQPTATTRQVSGNAPDGRPILAVLVKRTYTLRDDGRCEPADEQVPLWDEPQEDPAAPGVLLHDFDLYAHKPATDVVVRGHAYGRGRPRFEAAVRVAGRTKRLLVLGDRSASPAAGGGVLFGQPRAVERVPLSYTHAYGGRDAVAEAKHGNPLAEVLGRAVSPEDLAAGSLFLYPRNPCGKGYLMAATPEAVAALELPNLEDPLDPLTPGRVVAGGPLNWPRMPLPQATGWVGYDWFPRGAYLGLVAPHAPPDDPVAEVTRGFAPADILGQRRPSAAGAFRLTCGASPGLQLPYLRGGEPVALDGLHPTRPDFAFRLPAERPRIWTDGRKGTFNETQPVLHTVVIEPDEARLTLLWRGSAPALRPYLPQELEKMPFRVQWGG